MKWTIHELIKHVTSDPTFKFSIDFSDKIKDVDDIVDISIVSVEGDYEIYDNEEFIFYMRVECTLKMLCANTLEEVEVKLDLDIEEVLTTYKSDDSILIEGITIDLSPIIWSNIILEKPMRVTKEGASLKTDEIIEISDDEKANAFADLIEYKK